MRPREYFAYEHGASRKGLCFGQGSRLVFVSPNRVARFGLGEVGWLSGKRDPERWPLEPEMRQLDGPRIQCIYGKSEASDSLCTAPVMSNAQIIEQFAIDPRDLRYQPMRSENLMMIVARQQRQIDMLTRLPGQSKSHDG